jgi:hypothetical protein
MLRRGLARVLAIAVSIVAVSHSALAQESSADPSAAPGTNAVYLAGPNCPEESAFWSEVAAHRQNRETLESLKVKVEVSELETGAQARVTFVSSNGASSTRELVASGCREAAGAAALVVALALDAHLEERSAVKPFPARNVEPPPRPAPPSPGFPDAVQARERTERGVFWQFGGGVFAQQAIAPEPLIGATAFAGLGGHEASWEARIGVAFGSSGVTERSDASARFSLLAAQLEGCAFPIVRGKRFLVDPCLAAELGRVNSGGIENSRYLGEQRSTLWAAGGPLLRVSYAFSELRLEAYGGPWIRIAGTREYVFADSQESRSFHEVPPVGLVGGVRAALHLD